MKELLQAISDDWLPNKWSRLIAGSTATLTGAAFYLPEGLGFLGAQLTQQATLLVRYTAPLGILILGLLCLLTSVVLHNRSSRLTSEKLKFDDSTGTWVDETTGIHYCAKCMPQLLSPMKNETSRWYCPVCKECFNDPSRKKLPNPIHENW